MKQFKNLEILKLSTGRYTTRLSAKFRNRQNYKPEDPHLVLSFIPGTILDILVRQGQVVKRGDDLMILEAMKMQNQLKSKVDGEVKSIPVKKGDKVSKGTVLLEMD
jgi:biotin carboxyl carrier protein